MLYWYRRFPFCSKRRMYHKKLKIGIAGARGLSTVLGLNSLPERYRNATAEQAGAGHGGGDFFLVEDFIGAIRTGEAPIVDIYTACEWTAVGLLSEISVVNNGRTMEVPRFRKGMTLEEKGIKL